MTLEILCANKIINEIANNFESKLPWGEKYIYFSIIQLSLYFFPNLGIRLEGIGLLNFYVGRLVLFVLSELVLGIGA